jgi:glycosyltransferase involved in cell wall biosynthesis
MIVSVIIPVYNREFELRRAVKSVLNQTIQDFEILVVDDFSELDLEGVVKSVNDTRVKFLRLPKKGNANVCRNLGIKEAEGNYIALLDSDDEWQPNHLEKKIEAIERTKTDGVFGSTIIDNGSNQRVVLSRPLKENESMINYLLSDGLAQTSSYCFTSSSVKKIAWDESLFRHQDLDFSVRFSKAYKFTPTLDATSIVHWKKGEKRTEHFESMIRFIKTNKQDISPVNYCKYHRQIYANICNRNDVEQSVKNYYKSESIRYMQVLSLTDYMSTFGANRSGIYKLYLRVEFCFKILFS